MAFEGGHEMHLRQEIEYQLTSATPGVGEDNPDVHEGVWEPAPQRTDIGIVKIAPGKQISCGYDISC